MHSIGGRRTSAPGLELRLSDGCLGDHVRRNVVRHDVEPHLVAHVGDLSGMIDALAQGLSVAAVQALVVAIALLVKDEESVPKQFRQRKFLLDAGVDIRHLTSHGRAGRTEKIDHDDYRLGSLQGSVF